MKIEVFRCDHTRRVFFGLDEYRLHLRELAAKRIAEKKHKEAIRRVLALRPELSKCSTFPSIASWIEEHAQELREAGTRATDRADLKKPFHLKSVNFEIMRRDYLSVGSGGEKREGWGFRGTITFTMKNGPSFDIIKCLPVRTGSGSGNSHTGNHQMEVYLFDDDWPSLAGMHRMEETAHLVAG
jgi:hypothetical protein